MGYTLLKMRIYITEKADNITINGDIHYRKWKYILEKIEIYITVNGDIHYSKWQYTLQKIEIYITENRDIHYSK